MNFLHTSLHVIPAWWKTWIASDRYSFDQIPDLTGKVAIVTGANSGLGYATTVALAARGAHVFLACRSRERALAAIERARHEIQAINPSLDPKLEFLELDLNDINKCYRAAKEFLATGHPLHILVCNSGVFEFEFSLTADGIEKHFGVNHIGHFVFTMTLLDRIKESSPNRIVIVSSSAHEHSVPAGIDFETLNEEGTSDGWSRYGRSKLANILFGQELARRLADEKVYVNIVHPGTVKTEAALRMPGLQGLMVKTFFMTPERGALTQLYAATSPEIEEKDIRGKYFVPVANQAQPSPIANDMALQTRLWDYSEKLMHEKVDQKQH
ncbi:hypothetical protein BGZ73_007172 [Actinomortierella ambigua]|nr:hypothetical protein BGZ73_007172 [Actinomortierella ambigua]